MLVNGAKPETISAHPIDAKAWTVYRLAHLPPPVEEPRLGGTETAKKAIVIVANIRVDEGARYEFRITNRALRPVSITIAFEAAADFADMNEVKSGKRQQNAPVESGWEANGSGARLTFRYAHPQLHHATAIEFAGADFTRAGDTAHCRLTLQPGQCRRITIMVDAHFDATGIKPPVLAPGSGGDRWAEQCASLRTGNQFVQAAWDRAVSDLASLHLHEGEGAERFTFAAGVPNYLGLFGRDSLMAALQSALLNPLALRGALRLLRRTIAREYDYKYDAQPGRVLHQRVLSPLAILGKTPFLHYYGDYSAPGLFLLGVAWDLAQTGDAAFFRSMEPDIAAVLAWMERDGDADGDGFYEYETRAGKQGLKNQGWKDLGEAILHVDGRMVSDPIAVAEVQGLYFAARQALALAFAATGEHARAKGLLDDAAALKRRFNERFWMAEEKYVALALGPDKQPVRSIASNASECLAYGIVDDDKAGAVIERLMAPEMFSGWGIRTLSSRHPAYNPFGYHLGAVWPCTGAMAARGFKRYGDSAALYRLAEAVFAATRLFAYDRLPEVFGGNPRDAEHPHPGLYPGACAPQAWSASAIVALIGSLTGLTPLAPLNTLIVDPDLPDWLPELTLRNLTVGTARVSIRFQRGADRKTCFEVLEGAKEVRCFRPPTLPTGVRSDQLTAALQAAAQSAALPLL